MRPTSAVDDRGLLEVAKAGQRLAGRPHLEAGALPRAAATARAVALATPLACIRTLRSVRSTARMRRASPRSAQDDLARVGRGSVGPGRHEHAQPAARERSLARRPIPERTPLAWAMTRAFAGTGRGQEGARRPVAVDAVLGEGPSGERRSPTRPAPRPRLSATGHRRDGSFEASALLSRSKSTAMSGRSAGRCWRSSSATRRRALARSPRA